MPLKNKAKVLEALRSGKYKQYFGALTNSRVDAHCCIGVAAIVNDFDIRKHPYCTTETTADHVGLTIDEKRELIELNDCKKRTFNEIALYIEENIPDAKAP